MKTNPDLTGLRVEHDAIVDKFFFITKSFFRRFGLQILLRQLGLHNERPEGVEKKRKNAASLRQASLR